MASGVLGVFQYLVAIAILAGVFTLRVHVSPDALEGFQFVAAYAAVNELY